MGDEVSGSGPADDLESLVRDVRAALRDQMARGVCVEAVPERMRASAPTRAADPSVVEGWSSRARSARDAGPTGAAALRQVREELGDCRRCPLCKTRQNIVFGVGSPDADLVVVGEGPGAQEDAQGEPFVGQAGQMLDKMLENVLGLTRQQAYILNVVKCRPPRNRNPHPDEIAACRPFLEGQLAALRPKVILVLGAVAYKTLMNTEQGITRARGRWHIWRDPRTDEAIPVMPTFHPAYLLRRPEDKGKTFADLKATRARYDEEGGRR
jgi:DNA polymerase